MKELSTAKLIESVEPSEDVWMTPEEMGIAQKMDWLDVDGNEISEEEKIEYFKSRPDMYEVNAAGLVRLRHEDYWFNSMLDEELCNISDADWDQLAHDWSVRVATELGCSSEDVWAELNSYDVTEHESFTKFASSHKVTKFEDFYSEWRLQNPSNVPDLKHICGIVNKIQYIIKPATKTKIKLKPLKKNETRNKN